MIEYENLNNLNKPLFEEYKTAFNEVLESGWYVLGTKVKSLKNNSQVIVTLQHCVGVANGLDALNLSLRAFGFEKGSEVLVPSNTYIATILSIVDNGLQPILVEPNIEHLIILTLFIRKAISSKN
jgi:dTDP-4-amino-4,6-dideoxygalactose transaminase